MTAHTESTHEHASHGHAGETKVYLRTLIALLILTIITVAAAGIDFGSGNVVIALAIATIKATLVALFFMHLLHEKPVNAVIAVAGFLFLGLFLMFTAIDVGSRENLQPQNIRPVLQVPAPAPPAPAAPAGKAE